jgi:hypothetical protein
MKWQVVVLLALTVLILVIVSPWIFMAIKQAWIGWHEDWVKMVSAILTSIIIGQAFFWILGYDQIGLGWDTKKEYGLGQVIGEKVINKMPIDEATGWMVKYAEVVLDAVRMGTEGATYLRFGFVPDAVACVVTQPLWSGIEVTEKVVSTARQPEMIGTREQILLSIKCIYGSLFRIVWVGVIWLISGLIISYIQSPIEQVIHWIINLF